MTLIPITVVLMADGLERLERPERLQTGWAAPMRLPEAVKSGVDPRLRPCCVRIVGAGALCCNMICPSGPCIS